MEIVPVEYKTEELFGNLIDMIQVRLSEKKLEFLIDFDENIPSVLYGDVKRINQVLLNLLTNAAKYTEHGSVTFSAHLETFGENFIGTYWDSVAERERIKKVLEEIIKVQLIFLGK